MDGSTRLTVGIAVHNATDCFRVALGSIVNNTSISFDLVIVDDASTDTEINSTLEILSGIAGRDYPAIRRFEIIRLKKRMGFVHACNEIVKAADTEFIAIATSDIIVPNCWEDMIDIMEKNELSALGPVTNHAYNDQKLEFDSCLGYEMESGRLVACINDVNTRQYSIHGDEVVYIAGLYGFFTIYRYMGRWSVMNQESKYTKMIPGLFDLMDEEGQVFDEKTFGLGFMEDYDICTRLSRAGGKIAYAPGFYFHHFGSQSFKDSDDLWDENVQKYKEKWWFWDGSRSFKGLPVMSENSIEEPIAEIVVIRYASPEVEEQCIESLNRTQDVSYDLKVIRNFGTGRSLTKAWNDAIRSSYHEFVCLLNSDTIIVDPLWLRKMVDSMIENNQIVAVGPSSNNVREGKQGYHSLQTAGTQDSKVEIVDEITGFCWVIRKSLWGKLGEFDEGFPLYGQESEFLDRARKAGYFVGYQRNAFVYHYGGVNIELAEKLGLLNIKEERSKALNAHIKKKGGEQHLFNRCL